MTRDEKIAKAQELRQSGMTYPQIAETMGVAPSTPFKWLNPKKVAAYAPPSAAKQREWRETHRAPCPRCGDLMRVGSSSPSRGGGLCANCWRVERRRRRDRERARLIELWESGMPTSEIAAILNIVPVSVSIRISQLRAEGIEVAYRYRGNAERFGTAAQSIGTPT